MNRYKTASLVRYHIIENLLIESKQLHYRDSDKILLMCLDQSQQIFMPDDDTGKAFIEWLEMPRE